jgi:hypothetical protein
MRWNGRLTPVRLTPLLWPGLLLLCVTCAPAQPASGGAGRAGIRELVRESYRYDPGVRQRAMEEAAQDPEVVRLPRMTVTDTRLATLLEQILRGQRRAAEAEKPSLANGAAVDRTLGGRPVRVGVQPYQDLLPDHGARAGPDGQPIARWNLLSMRW